MAQSDFEKAGLTPVTVQGRRFVPIEEFEYPNGGLTRFYLNNDDILAVDYDICEGNGIDSFYPYSMITDKQNQYMKQYSGFYRVLAQDLDTMQLEEVTGDWEQRQRIGDRAETPEVSPLEFLFEELFTDVYGISALNYLMKEYCILDNEGHQYFLDYVIHTQDGTIAVEENGVSYHHPQIIGVERYRRQLQKQNACTQSGIKLFRFSTEDCRFKDRIRDDIRTFFGENTDRFLKNSILLGRKVELYEHQKVTLADIQKKRAEGVSSFLIVFPTASGKSRIVEEDLKIFASSRPDSRALILAPSRPILDDWKERLQDSLSFLENRIDIRSFAYMARHYQEFDTHAYSYIVVDEAHHAVAPVLKRTIQHFVPEFLVGLTATDQRPDKKKLETVFGNYETGLTLIQAMEQGIVAKANVFRIETNLDLSMVRFNGKDYVNADLEKTIRVKSRNEMIADVLCQYFNEGAAGERQGVVFCVNTRHTKEMERVLTERGLSAKAYSGKEKHPEKIMSDFKHGKIRFLCACNMISEGWDYPELGILVMARPTLSKVLYLQQIGRGLRKTQSKKNVFVIDVVDEYGAMAKPCSMHAIFNNAMYVPFGDITKRNYRAGDFIEVGGIVERIEAVIPVDIETFDEKYGDYLNQEQLAREFYMSTGSVTAWIKKGKITPSEMIEFGSRKIYLFSPEKVESIREEFHLGRHDDTTIYQDFFDFLEERDYSLSYKITFLTSFLKNMNAIGEAKIDDILNDYIAFYEDRIERGLAVDRKTCPYDSKRLKDRSYIRENMLTNPFEKFERKRFLYYSKELGMIALNHALFSQLTEKDYDRIRNQMSEDRIQYYRDLGGV